MFTGAVVIHRRSLFLCTGAAYFRFFIALAFICLECYFILFGSPFFRSPRLPNWDLCSAVWNTVHRSNINISRSNKTSRSLSLSFVHFLRHQKQIVIIWYIFVWSCLWQPSYGLKRWFYLFFSVRLISTQKFPLFATWIYEQIYQEAIKMKPNHMSHNFLNVSDACRHMRKWTESD